MSADPLGVRPTLVRFIRDDAGGLWNAGDTAWDLGWEGPFEPGHPEHTPIRLLKTTKGGETLALMDPYGWGMIEAVQ